MTNLRHLLAAMAALTLVLSVISGISPTFTGLNAFAENGDDSEEEDDHNSGSSGSNSNDDEEDDQEDDDSSDDSEDDEEHGNNSSNSTHSDDNEGEDDGRDHGVNSSDDDEEDDDSNEHQQRRHEIVSTVTGREIHERHMNANPSSPGDYPPGWNYTLIVDGTATNETGDNTVNATVQIEMAVWKSTPAIALLDITNGTVQIDGQEYEVRIGYALYAPEHGVMRLGALVSDDSGHILKLTLRGNSTEDAELPTETGKSIGMSFDDLSGSANNRLEGWSLTLEGTVKAG